MDSHAVKSQQNVAVHTISFRGKAGAIFVLLCFTLALFLVGFITTRWSRDGNNYLGIWENCTCVAHNYKGDTQLIAINSLLAASLLFLLISLLLITIYMCVHTVSKNSTIIALVFFTFFSFVFSVVGYTLYAVLQFKNYSLFWSFGLVVASSFFCLLAGIVSIVQLKSSGVRL